MTCTRCGGCGFLNSEAIPERIGELSAEETKEWIDAQKEHGTDACVCDCCGNGSEWYGLPGEHYTSSDPRGNGGPYAYNGGLCECN